MDKWDDHIGRAKLNKLLEWHKSRLTSKLLINVFQQGIVFSLMSINSTLTTDATYLWFR